MIQLTKKKALIIVMAVACVSCSTKKDLPGPDEQLQDQLTEVPYSKIEGGRSFNGMKTSSVVYTAGNPSPNQFDTVLLSNIKMQFTLLNDTTLAVLCNDSQMLINDSFPLKLTEINADTSYIFSKSLSLHSGASVSFNLTTNKVLYTAGGGNSGPGAYTSHNATLQER